MTIRITRVLSADEFIAMGEAAVRDGYYCNDHRVFTPGMAWTMPWIFDPTGERKLQNKRTMIDSAESLNANHLSVHYWRDWAHIRPPICVVCPNGQQHEIDRTSSNGLGWVVRGELPTITVYPSIVVTGYHGHLTDGLFTPDIDRRGPNGIKRY